MARPVDPQRYSVKRAGIISAAYEAIAELGFDSATTAVICRRAGISSGTFFHYFPTKLAVLEAILRQGADDRRSMQADTESADDPREVVLAYLAAVAREAEDPHAGGFVRAVSGLVGEPVVDQALAAEDAADRRFLERWLLVAQQAGGVRTDWSAAQLATWLMVLLEGYLARTATAAGFDAREQAAALLEVADRILSPAPRVIP